MKTKRNLNTCRQPKQKAKKKHNSIAAITIAFIVLFSLFLYCRLGLNSVNGSLTADNQKLSEEITQTQTEIDDLKIQINLLQEKSRVLGMLDGQVSDNQNRIFVIDST